MRPEDTAMAGGDYLDDDLLKFWLVWNPARDAPRHQHRTRQEAITEAERLARQCPGQKFIVLEAMEMRTVDDMRRVQLQIDHSIPF